MAALRWSSTDSRAGGGARNPDPCAGCLHESPEQRQGNESLRTAPTSITPLAPTACGDRPCHGEARPPVEVMKPVIDAPHPAASPVATRKVPCPSGGSPRTCGGPVLARHRRRCPDDCRPPCRHLGACRLCPRCPKEAVHNRRPGKSMGMGTKGCRIRQHLSICTERLPAASIESPVGSASNSDHKALADERPLPRPRSPRARDVAQGHRGEAPHAGRGGWVQQRPSARAIGTSRQSKPTSTETGAMVAEPASISLRRTGCGLLRCAKCRKHRDTDRMSPPVRNRPPFPDDLTARL